MQSGRPRMTRPYNNDNNDNEEDGSTATTTAGPSNGGTASPIAGDRSPPRRLPSGKRPAAALRDDDQDDYGDYHQQPEQAQQPPRIRRTIGRPVPSPTTAFPRKTYPTTGGYHQGAGHHGHHTGYQQQQTQPRPYPNKSYLNPEYASSSSTSTSRSVGSTPSYIKPLPYTKGHHYQNQSQATQQQQQQRASSSRGTSPLRSSRPSHTHHNRGYEYKQPHYHQKDQGHQSADEEAIVEEYEAGYDRRQGHNHHQHYNGSAGNGSGYQYQRRVGSTRVHHSGAGGYSTTSATSATGRSTRRHYETDQQQQQDEEDLEDDDYYYYDEDGTTHADDAGSPPPAPVARRGTISKYDHHHGGSSRSRGSGGSYQHRSAQDTSGSSYGSSRRTTISSSSSYGSGSAVASTSSSYTRRPYHSSSTAVSGSSRTAMASSVSGGHSGKRYSERQQQLVSHEDMEVDYEETDDGAASKDVIASKKSSPRRLSPASKATQMDFEERSLVLSGGEGEKEMTDDSKEKNARADDEDDDDIEIELNIDSDGTKRKEETIKAKGGQEHEEVDEDREKGEWKEGDGSRLASSPLKKDGADMDCDSEEEGLEAAQRPFSRQARLLNKGVSFPSLPELLDSLGIKGRTFYFAALCDYYDMLVKTKQSNYWRAPEYVINKIRKACIHYDQVLLFFTVLDSQYLQGLAIVDRKRRIESPSETDRLAKVPIRWIYLTDVPFYAAPSATGLYDRRGLRESMEVPKEDGERLMMLFHRADQFDKLRLQCTAKQ